MKSKPGRSDLPPRTQRPEPHRSEVRTSRSIFLWAFFKGPWEVSGNFHLVLIALRKMKVLPPAIHSSGTRSRPAGALQPSRTPLRFKGTTGFVRLPTLVQVCWAHQKTVGSSRLDGQWTAPTRLVQGPTAEVQARPNSLRRDILPKRLQDRRQLPTPGGWEQYSPSRR